MNNLNLEQMLKQIHPVENSPVIVANGEFPQSDYLIQIIKDSTLLICCDGAANTLDQLNITPDYIIGDCDSVDPKVKTNFTGKLIVNPDQNTNDLTKAVKLAQSLNLANVTILGATGKREDHTLANIGLLTKYIDEIDNTAIISAYGILTAYNTPKQVKINTLPGQQISFFALTNTQVTCKELKWPLKNYTLDNLYSGSLNEALGYHLDLTSNNKIILYRAF